MERRPPLAAVLLSALLMSVTASACSVPVAATPSQGQIGSSRVLEAYDALLTASDEYETGAKAAAETSGPTGLASWAIAHRFDVSTAVLALRTALQQDPSAGGFPKPELVEAVADAAQKYGDSLMGLGLRLDQCDVGDLVCYEAAYEADAQGSAKREAFRAAVAAVRAEAAALR